MNAETILSILLTASLITILKLILNVRKKQADLEKQNKIINHQYNRLKKIIPFTYAIQSDYILGNIDLSENIVNQMTFYKDNTLEEIKQHRKRLSSKNNKLLNE